MLAKATNRLIVDDPADHRRVQSNSNRALLSPSLSGPVPWQSLEALSMPGDMCESVCIVCSAVPFEVARCVENAACAALCKCDNAIVVW